MFGLYFNIHERTHTCVEVCLYTDCHDPEVKFYCYYVLLSHALMYKDGV